MLGWVWSEHIDLNWQSAEYSDNICLFAPQNIKWNLDLEYIIVKISNQCHWGVLKKTRIFYIPLGPDHNANVKMLSHFFIDIWFFDTQNSFQLNMKGVKNEFFMPLTPLLCHNLTILWQSSRDSKEESGILVLGRK